MNVLEQHVGLNERLVGIPDIRSVGIRKPQSRRPWLECVCNLQTHSPVSWKTPAHSSS
jgi:hypothetical protein